jgi:hypothetical protein
MTGGRMITPSIQPSTLSLCPGFPFVTQALTETQSLVLSDYWVRGAEVREGYWLRHMFTRGRDTEMNTPGQTITRRRTGTKWR